MPGWQLASRDPCQLTGNGSTLERRVHDYDNDMIIYLINVLIIIFVVLNYARVCLCAYIT